MYFKALLCSATVSFVRCSGTGSAGEVFCGGRVLQLQGPSPKGIRSEALEVQVWGASQSTPGASGQSRARHEDLQGDSASGSFHFGPALVGIRYRPWRLEQQLSYRIFQFCPEFPHVGIGEGEQSHASSTQTRVAGVHRDVPSVVCGEGRAVHASF